MKITINQILSMFLIRLSSSIITDRIENRCKTYSFNRYRFQSQALLEEDEWREQWKSEWKVRGIVWSPTEKHFRSLSTATGTVKLVHKLLTSPRFVQYVFLASKVSLLLPLLPFHRMQVQVSRSAILKNKYFIKQ